MRQSVLAVAMVIMTVPAFGFGPFTKDPETELGRVKAENKELKKRVKELEEKVLVRDQKLARFEAQKSDLRGDAGFYERRANALAREKRERERELRLLRLSVRQFTDAVRDTLEQGRPEIMDYFGGELIDRELIETDDRILLVDRQNTLSHPATLTGGRAYVKGYSKLSFCLLRPTDSTGDRVEVVAMSQAIDADGEGFKEWSFFEPMAAAPGDMIGVYCHGPANIPYDAMGTGAVGVLSTSEPKAHGTKLSLKSVAGQGRQGRAYSFGMIGFVRVGE